MAVVESLTWFGLVQTKALSRGHVMGWVLPLVAGGHTIPDIHQRSNHFADGCPLVRPHRRDRLGKEASGHRRSSAIVDCC